MGLKYVPTTCPYCGTGCSFNLVTIDNKVVDIAPYQRSLVNEGKLCPKGMYAYQFVNHKDRLKVPLIKRNGKFIECTWEYALSTISKRFAQYIPDEIAILASASATNEDNYTLMKFARGVIKTNNIDHCARLCHSSTVTGLGSTLGSGAMTNSISDIATSKCIFIIGSNTFEQHPLIARKVVQAQKNGAKIINIDPRKTATSLQSDLYLQIKCGTDVALLNAIMQEIITNKWHNTDFISKRCYGYSELKNEVLKPEYSLESASTTTGVPIDKIKLAAKYYATSRASTILYAMGITQHTVGVDNVKALADLAMLTGNIGKPGTGVCPLRGQNNVQGACDVGCLPDVFPGYQPVEDSDCHLKFKDKWGFPDEICNPIKGLEITVLMKQLAEGVSKCKLMYIMGENPMISDANIGHVKHVLSNLDFLIVQDIFMTETAKIADIVLPAACFAEKNGTQTSTERRVQRVRKAQEPPGKAKPDWKIITELAGKMGYKEQFPYKDPSEIFNELTLLTNLYSGMSYSRVSKPDGVQWPCPSLTHPGTPILHTSTFNNMPNNRSQMFPISYKTPAEKPTKEYPYLLTTGRCLFQWHTGTMSRKSPSLETEVPFAWIEINDKDADELKITNNQVVKVKSRRGEINITAKITSNIMKGIVFIPFHFKEAAANILTNNALDPESKIPEYKVCAVKIEPLGTS